MSKQWELISAIEKELVKLGYKQLISSSGNIVSWSKTLENKQGVIIKFWVVHRTIQKTIGTIVNFESFVLSNMKYERFTDEELKILFAFDLTIRYQHYMEFKQDVDDWF